MYVVSLMMPPLYGLNDSHVTPKSSWRGARGVRSAGGELGLTLQGPKIEEGPRPVGVTQVYVSLG